LVLAIKTKFSSREKELDLHLDRRVRMPLFSELFDALRPALVTFLNEYSSIVPLAVSLVLCYVVLSRSRPTSTSTSSPSPHQILNLMRQRRSVFPKDYSGALPPRASIEAMLEAANWAPTHGKTEPWRFVVMNGEGLKTWSALVHKRMEARLGAGSEAFRKYAEKTKRKAKDKAKVGYLIAICMKRKALPDKEMPEWEEIAAVSCAVQNMHLLATAMGIAAYWSSGGPLDDREVLSFLNLDAAAGDRCLGLFHVGEAPAATIEGYRAKRGAVSDKTTWMVDPK
jgi:nitroreductase